MPEKHLSADDARAFYTWLGANSSPLHTCVVGASAVSIGETGEPVFIKPVEPNELECNVHYPTGSEDELSKSGVIFEKAKATLPPSDGHREPISN